MSTALATTEAARLGELEQTIEGGLQTFVEVGEALMEIRDSRLYRADFNTFEDYCRERWDFTRQRAHQLTEAAEVSTMVDVQNERQARELAPLKDDEAGLVAALREANEATNGKVTAMAIRTVVKQHVVRAAKERERDQRQDHWLRRERCQGCGRTHEELGQTDGFIAFWSKDLQDGFTSCGLEMSGFCRECFTQREHEEHEEGEREERRRREELGEDRYRALQRQREHEERRRRAQQGVHAATRVFWQSEGLLEWLCLELDGLRRIDPADCIPEQLQALRAGVDDAEAVLAEIRSWTNGDNGGAT